MRLIIFENENLSFLTQIFLVLETEKPQILWRIIRISLLPISFSTQLTEIHKNSMMISQTEAKFNFHIV